MLPLTVGRRSDHQGVGKVEVDTFGSIFGPERMGLVSCQACHEAVKAFFDESAKTAEAYAPLIAEQGYAFSIPGFTVHSPKFCNLCNEINHFDDIPKDEMPLPHYPVACPWVWSGDYEDQANRIIAKQQSSNYGSGFAVRCKLLRDYLKHKKAPVSSLMQAAGDALDLSTVKKATLAIEAAPDNLVVEHILPRLPYPVFAELYYKTKTLDHLNVDQVFEVSMHRYVSSIKHTPMLPVFETLGVGKTAIPLEVSAFAKLSDFMSPMLCTGSLDKIMRDRDLTYAISGGAIVTALCESMQYEASQDIDIFVGTRDQRKTVGLVQDVAKLIWENTDAEDGDLLVTYRDPWKHAKFVAPDSDPQFGSVVTIHYRAGGSVQIIFVDDVADSIGGFDLDIVQVAWMDGCFQATYRGLYALKRGFNRIRLPDVPCGTSKIRVEKYERRGVPTHYESNLRDNETWYEPSPSNAEVFRTYDSKHRTKEHLIIRCADNLFFDGKWNFVTLTRGAHVTGQSYKHGSLYNPVSHFCDSAWLTNMVVDQTRMRNFAKDWNARRENA